MFSKLPPLHALAAFEAAARHQSFADAAEELCITQSAISYRIRLLENHYGERFFLRTGRSVTLTAEGSRFLTTVLDALSTLESASNQFLDKSREKIRVSVGLAFASNWLVPRLGDFYSKVPGIDLEIRANKTNDRNKLSDLKSGEADISIRSARMQEWPGFASTKLLDSEMFPVCSPKYRELAGGIGKPRDLLRAVLLRLTLQPWSGWLRAAGLPTIEPAEGPIFSSTGLMLDAATSGQGVALVRSALVSRDLETGKLVRLFDVAIPSDVALYAIYQPQTAERPEVASFISWIIGACALPKD